jgi:hypothetical protein
LNGADSESKRKVLQHIDYLCTTHWLFLSKKEESGKTKEDPISITGNSPDWLPFFIYIGSLSVVYLFEIEKKRTRTSGVVFVEPANSLLKEDRYPARTQA